jgi:TolA-binding protein
MDDSGLSDDPRIGQLVDERYKVLQAMASGSMGVVYKAERVPVGKLVAIKFLHATFANDAEFLARFERETRVMSKLTHPNCVSVVDFGVWEGAPYLVMEYVSGTTLRALIDNGALPVRRALALGRQIAAGLAHAHAQGVVHRDVKPANIMISEEIGTGDHARILDFGLARLRGAVGRDATQTNVVVGTPNYMAPEQTVGGGLIDARTDIYAVGVVLFEMITGDRPFQADDTLALLGMHRAAPIPALAERVEPGVALPDGLQDIVDRAMAKSPGDRFQSAIELAEAIDAITGGRELSGPVRVADLKSGAVRVVATGNLKVEPGPGGKKATGTAPTMLDISDARGGDADTASSIDPVRARAPRRSLVGSLAFIVILLGAAGAGVLWLRGDDKPERTAVTEPSVGSDTAAKPVPAPAPAPAAVGSQAAAPAGQGAQDAPPDAPAAGAGSSAGSSTDAQADSPPDIEMDPATAEDPAPASVKPSSDADEAVNAPRTPEEAEKHTPHGPALATTLAGAVQLIKEDKRDLALASLQALWKKTPQSAYIPFLLGNLYYDQRWWSVAMDHYGAAIKKNGRYRSNPTLNRNVIRTLASNKTARKAQGFLKGVIGRPAVPYLRVAAKQDGSAQVRRLSAWLLRSM